MVSTRSAKVSDKTAGPPTKKTSKSSSRSAPAAATVRQLRSRTVVSTPSSSPTAKTTTKTTSSIDSRNEVPAASTNSLVALPDDVQNSVAESMGLPLPPHPETAPPSQPTLDDDAQKPTQRNDDVNADVSPTGPNQQAPVRNVPIRRCAYTQYCATFPPNYVDIIRASMKEVLVMSIPRVQGIVVHAFTHTKFANNFLVLCAFVVAMMKRPETLGRGLVALD